METAMANSLLTEYQKEKVMSAFASLPPKQQRIIYLNRFEGRSIQEIAEQMNESIETVRHEFYLGLKAIKETLHG
jgi:RNA polymerase sigma factor (sigma-70 family)